MRPSAFLRYWLPVFAVMGVIFWMSTGMFTTARTLYLIKTIVDFFRPSTTNLEAAALNYGARKFAHVFEYFILGLVLFRAFRHGGKTKRGIFVSMACAVLLVALYAFTDEFHQVFVPGRGGGEISDVGIDTLGGVFAQVVGVFKFR